MRKGILFAAAAAVLTALAFFLPEWLSAQRDKQLLDSPSIQVQNGEQEGFAESLELSVAEKLLMLRSGTMTVMALDQGSKESEYLVVYENAEAKFSVLPGEYTENLPAELKAESENVITAYEEEMTQIWQERFEAVQNELRSLQAAGGLPELWTEDGEVYYTGYGDLLYMDPDTKISFQAYRASIESESYSIDVTIDLQSGRILCFNLRWSRGTAPNWGIRGASNFGSVWRNYWGLDSVSSGWYNEYNKSILEQTEESYRINGDYNAHGQISFTYDGQSIPVPLDCEAYSGRSFAISWNN